MIRKDFMKPYKSLLKTLQKQSDKCSRPFVTNLDYESIKLFPSKDIKNINYTLENGLPYTIFNLKIWESSGFLVLENILL